MIPVDLSANCEVRIYNPIGPGIQIIGIRSRDLFSGFTHMSGPNSGTFRHRPNLDVVLDLYDKFILCSESSRTRISNSF